MVDFSLFRLRDDLGDFDMFVDFESDRTIYPVGPIDRPGFTAKLYFTDTVRPQPPWLSFVEEGFEDSLPWQSSRNVSALIIVNIDPNGIGQFFALAFGTAGRHMLRSDAYRPRYGLIAALNLVAADHTSPQLRSFDTTRHGRGVLRSRLQTAALSAVDVFELDLLRDLVRNATGQPADIERWGRRVGGSDVLRVARDIRFEELGELCTAVDEVASSGAYREQFDWIDNIQPVSDQTLLTVLEDEVVGLIRDQRTDILQLAPPEVADWDRLSQFQYHFDTRLGLRRSDLLLSAYLGGLRVSDPGLKEVTVDWLRRRQIIGLDGDHARYRSWSVWRCLVGEFEYDQRSYVLEDGSFYQVAESYLQQLNDEILPFSGSTGLQLPPAPPDPKEPEYNKQAAASSDSLLLLDTFLVPISGARGGIELCDLLTDQRQFVHVKRAKGGSQQLSHLFAQARVAAEQLLVNASFRSEAKKLVGHRGNEDPRFDVIDPAGIRAGDFEIVLAIIKKWGASDIDSLPFFAKVDLRRTLVDLAGRGYRASVVCIPIESD